MNRNNIYCIHASNIAGLGSRMVVSNLLFSLSKIENLSNSKVYLYLPKIAFWDSFIKNFNSNWEILLIPRSKFKIIRLLQRVYDILFGYNDLPDIDILIILGDFPVRSKKKQIVLFHNLNLISNKSSLKFLFHKLFFNLNTKYISKCVVQSNVVKSDLVLKYPKLNRKIQVLPMPVDDLYENKFHSKSKNTKLECFYPASYYSHKNHKVIVDLCKYYELEEDKFHFYFTISNNLTTKLNLYSSSLITNLGQLTNKEVYNKYLDVDVLIFPSLLESYGIPLIEAMKMNLYIICADLPYARWMCGNQAKYFDPLDPNSLKISLEQVFIEKSNNIKPNWNEALSKIPNNWDIYATKFFELIL